MNFEQAYEAIVNKMPQGFDDEIEGVILKRQLRKIPNESLIDIVESVLTSSGWTDLSVVKRVIDDFLRTITNPLRDIAKTEASKIYQKLEACFTTYDNKRYEDSSVDIKTFMFMNFKSVDSGEPFFKQKEIEVLGAMYKEVAIDDGATAFERFYQIARFLNNNILYDSLENIIYGRLLFKTLPQALPKPQDTPAIFKKLADMKRLSHK
jgi:hypothetical protein